MLVRGEHFPDIADHILMHYDKQYSDPTAIKDGDIVYCDTHHLMKYVDVLNTKKDLVLITHNSDGFLTSDLSKVPMRHDSVDVNQFKGCYRYWFGQNNLVDPYYAQEAPIESIPIGFENRRWDRGGEKEFVLNNIKQISAHKDMYFNCNILTNMTERSRCLEYASQYDFVTVEENNLSYSQYFQTIQQHRYVISPMGNGMDCHRTWEILLAGRRPVMKVHTGLLRLYSSDVHWVQDWNNMEFEESFENMYERDRGLFNRAKLYQQYWNERIYKLASI